MICLFKKEMTSMKMTVTYSPAPLGLEEMMPGDKVQVDGIPCTITALQWKSINELELEVQTGDTGVFSLN
tara:strand:- start:1605 stop:1814 length:210 start_codon:yes stop_codon:yes gene_type:complete